MRRDVRQVKESVARRVLRGAVCVALFLGWSFAAAAEKEPERTGGPFVPTPQVVVDAMLRMANVGPKDFVVDLGSGDGVIVLTAATQLKAAGYGVDIDSQLVSYSNAEAKRLGVADRAAFYVQDVFKADLSRATVITLYLLPSMMVNLRPKMFVEPRPGTRIVSHDYNFDEWQPDDQIVFDVPEKEKVNGVPRATINLWIVPARVQGKWQVQLESGEQFDLALRQKYQIISGAAEGVRKSVRLAYPMIKGEQISFTLLDGGTRRDFTGTVGADDMKGTVDIGNGRTARWTAKRI
ncbi:MAG TPA: methyltransferase domain-containing protein [Burkholderiales bacterium]|nr:methyltransferase domain-containing protein [Burkholderiales bacterium]